MPYNVQSKNPDTKWDGLVDKKLAELEKIIANLEARVKYVEGRTK